MNVDAINQLIERIKVRPWASRVWDLHSECMVGIFQWANGGCRHNSTDDASFNFARALDLNHEQRVALYVMGNCRHDQPPRMLDPFARAAFCEQPVEMQNSQLVELLTRLRDTGDVIWPHWRG